MERGRYAVGELTVHVVALRDRRRRAAPEELWVFHHTLERALFGSTTGALHRLYERSSLTQAPLALKKASIPDLCTAPELAQLLALLTETLPFESKGRVRNATLLPLNLVPVLAAKLGRSPRTTALLEALRQPLPRLWAAQAEQEAHAAAGEVDLLLEEGALRCPRPPLPSPPPQPAPPSTATRHRRCPAALPEIPKIRDRGVGGGGGAPGDRARADGPIR